MTRDTHTRDGGAESRRRPDDLGGRSGERVARRGAWSRPVRFTGLLAATLVTAGMLVACSDDSEPPLPAAKTDLGRPLQIDRKPSAGPPCEPAAEGGAIRVTESCVDPDLNQPYVDIDEKRTITDSAAKVTVDVRHVHGGFSGTKAKFSFYFPERYQGRFFESTYPTLSTEEAAPNTVAFAATNGAYVVSTNNAGGLPGAGDIAGYRVNAAAAKFSRTVAAQVYGDTARPRGFIYGASGGAYQTIGALENTEGVWDGGVPMVPGTPNAIPSSMTVQLLALRVLRDAFPRIVDALEPGGSGDPYAGLTGEQRDVLREVTRLGLPIRGWWDYRDMSGGAFFAVGGGVRILDPTYVDDFWSLPGYAGTDPASSAAAARIQHEAEVTALVSDPGTPARPALADVQGTPTIPAAPPGGLTLSSVPTGPAGDLAGADIVVLSGAAAGSTIPLGEVRGNTITYGTGADPAITAALRPGDRLRLDNSWIIALQYYHRHQVPPTDEYAWDQFRGADGTPRYPQRPVLAGPTFAQAASGAIPTGTFHGKMIMLASLLDTQSFPWPADWYHGRARAHLGPKLADHYRLWFMDNADHIPPRDAAAGTHVVRYLAELQQALLYLDAWVRDGTAPPASTTYQVDGDTQVRVPASSAERHGVQPVVDLAVTAVAGRGIPAAGRAEVSTGQPVALTVTAQVPPDAGDLVSVEWDFDGSGEYPEHSELDKPARETRLTINHTFTRPGTYFPVVRVTSRRPGDDLGGADGGTPYGLVQNLARVRVVVR
ncbi:PKD domain protein [Frankia sp. EI5c]|uniref:PKD domain-containing protein n=1 Tax=Frankia sp. EI5c TaxID=683316 RepID=UPI0007C35E1E|nr:PKD domain-containing protein [Frankia sp. EI5c]OAA25212.1 PKD domain protein [Frankia sp. EI5c]